MLDEHNLDKAAFLNVEGWDAYPESLKLTDMLERASFLEPVTVAIRVVGEGGDPRGVGSHPQCTDFGPDAR